MKTFPNGNLLSPTTFYRPNRTIEIASLVLDFKIAAPGIEWERRFHLFARLRILFHQAFLESGDQGRDDLVEITHHAIAGNFEDRRIRILIDGYDHLA